MTADGWPERPTRNASIFEFVLATPHETSTLPTHKSDSRECRMRMLGIVCGWSLLLALGCQGSTPVVDPFGTYGPSRIPPPPTGTAGRSDPYYRRPLASNPADQTPRLSSLPSVPQSQFRSDRPAPNDGASSDSFRSYNTTAGQDNTGLDWRNPVEGQYTSYEAMNYEGSRPRPRFNAPTGNELPTAPMELDSRSLQTATQMSPTVSRGASSGWQASGRY